MLERFQELNQDLDCDEELTRFFGVIQHFNGNQPFDEGLKQQIEEYQRYKWENDKNQAFSQDQDLAIYSELPEEIQFRLHREFLFQNFVKTHKAYFCFEKKFSHVKYNFYNWNDQIYA